MASIEFSEAAKRLVGSPMFKVLARVQELERAGNRIIHFEIGDPDFKTPAHITQAAIDALMSGDTHYANSLGIRELREAVRTVTKNDIGFEPDLEQIVVAPSISFIYFVVQALLNPGDEVLVSDPGYSSYFAVFDFLDIKPASVPLYEKNAFRMKAADVERCITPRTKLIIINSPQNPTGAVIAADDLRAIYELAVERGIYILSDEMYSMLYYNKKPTSIAIHDACRERVIVLNGFSKAFAMTGWRLGYAIAPKEITEKIGLMIQTIISSIPPFIQRGGVAALTGSRDCVQKMVKEYKQRRQIMTDGLNQLPGVSCPAPDGALYAFPNISATGYSSVDFTMLILKRAGVAVLPGTDFGKRGEGFIRVTFTSSQNDIREGISRMQKVLHG